MGREIKVESVREKNEQTRNKKQEKEKERNCHF